MRAAFALPNAMDAVGRLIADVEAFARAAGCDTELVLRAMLAVEEIATNAIRHGYADSRAGRIEVMLEWRDTELHAEIADDGDAFNPFADAPSPDFATAPRLRQAGGLGVHLVRRQTEAAAYRREAGRNVVTLRLVRR